MFAFDRSAFAVLAPLALLAIAVAVSNYAPQQRMTVQQAERPRDSHQPESELTISDKKVVIVVRNDQAATRR